MKFEIMCMFYIKCTDKQMHKMHIQKIYIGTKNG